MKEQPIELSSREIDVLEILLTNPSRIVSKQQFIEKLCSWDDEITIKAVETYVSRLRRKLKGAEVHFKTVWGVGYLLEEVNEQ